MTVIAKNLGASEYLKPIRLNLLRCQYLLIENHTVIDSAQLIL
jgi:hypothetical protein